MDDGGQTEEESCLMGVRGEENEKIEHEGIKKLERAAGIFLF